MNGHLVRSKLLIDTANFVACLIMVLSLSIPTNTEAGALSRSIERSAAKRLGMKGSANATAAERSALKTLWHELDQAALAKIVQRYGSYIDRDRLALAGRTPSVFMDSVAFERHLQTHFPRMSTSEREAILGYYFQEGVYINGNQVHLPITTAHERLHQLAHPQFRQTFGIDGNEGMTEVFARRIYVDLRLSDLPEVYPTQQSVISMLGAHVGEHGLARAYFRGDMSALRHRLDSELGAGMFRRISTALAEGDIQRAKRLLSGQSDNL